MALWGLSVADRPSALEGKTAVMRFICIAGRKMVNAGRETSMAKHDFSISGFEIIANAVAAENCRLGIHFMPCARASGRDWRRVWLTAEDQALCSASVQPNAADTKSGTKILAFCCPFS